MRNENAVEIPQCYTRLEIPVIECQIPTPEVLTQWEHLSHVAERLHKYTPELEIGLGRNCIKALEPLEVVPSGDKGLMQYDCVMAEL